MLASSRLCIGRELFAQKYETVLLMKGTHVQTNRAPYSNEGALAVWYSALTLFDWPFHG